MSVLLLAAALAATGCERRSDTPAPAADAPAATIIATAGFGAEPLLDGRVAPGGSVLDGLRALTPVRTAYGGGFVEEMLGRGSDPGDRVDWIYWVDGVLADRGADQVRLADGQQAWWDHHHWGGVRDPWAVVGAWPLPFTRAPAVSADAPLASAVTAAGGTVTGGRSAWRVRVGADAELRRTEPAWAAAAADPAGAGLTATIRDGRVLLLDPAGRRLAPEPAARAIAVAFPSGPVAADGVVMAVVGVDAASALAAAETIADDGTVLRHRLAVAFDGSGVPVRSAGSARP